MCRSIKKLLNPINAVTEEDVHAAALQFVRKVSGMRHPSRQNSPVFEKATDDIQLIVQNLLKSLKVSSRTKL